MFRYPHGVAACLSNAGALEVLVADTGNHRVRQVRSGVRDGDDCMLHEAVAEDSNEIF